MDLMLIENPRRRRRRYNPIGFDQFGNPIEVFNPRRKKVARRRRNPVQNQLVAARTTLREWTQGVDLMDAGAAVAGLAASTMLPGAIIKDVSTTGKKIAKLALALLAAIGAGAVGRAMVSPSAGKAAVIGGIAGTVAQALGMFTAIKIGQPVGRRIGTTTMVSPPFTREGETISVIEP